MAPNCQASADCLAARKFYDINQDGKIDRFDLTDNGSPLKNLLRPDVQLFDANGRFAPNMSTASADSLSIGIGFTAKRAFFAE